MRVVFERSGRVLFKRFSGSLACLLKLLKLNSESVLVAKNDSLILGDEILFDEDSVCIMEITSGG